MTKPVLVAGLGNVFLGDDAFGVEVAQRLLARGARDGVRVLDIGTRAVDLAYALEDHDVAILVDVVARGGPPGTLYVLEIDARGDAAAGATDAHALTPDAVLRSLRTPPRIVRLVGCEPSDFGDEDAGGRLGLSAPVSIAVDEAVRLVDGLVAELLPHA